MTNYEKIQQCKIFFNELKKNLRDDYIVMGSCSRDVSAYLIPKGTKSQVTYYGKPELSFRISDHWNWYSNLKKCSEEDNIQCNCISLPSPNERNAPGKASDPIKAVCVAFYYKEIYYSIYGDLYNFKNNCWDWVESSPSDIISLLKNLQYQEICDVSKDKYKISCF